MMNVVISQKQSVSAVASPWTNLLGPCYVDESVRRELDMTQEELHRARRELRLLVLRTADGRDVYPAFQIVDGKLVTGLREVLLELRRGTHDSWTWAQWLGAPNESAGPGTALRNIDRLVAGAVSETIRAATQSAVIWAS